MNNNTGKQYIKDVVSGTITYYGESDVGVAETSRKWAIWREEISGSTITKKMYPVGNKGVVSADEFFAWSERATLAYGAVDDTVAPTLSTVTIASNNADTTKAKVGDIVTITIVGSEVLRNVVAVIGGLTATIVQGVDALHYTAAVTLDSSVPTWAIAFSIGFTDIGGRSGVNVTAVTGGSGVTFDKTLPTMVSAVHTDDTHLNVLISELGLTASITKANAGGFTVEDAVVPATTYAVSSILPGVDNTHVILVVAATTLSLLTGLKVKYTAGGNGTVADLAGNLMATNTTGVTIAPW